MSQATSNLVSRWHFASRWLLGIGLLGLAVGAGLTYRQWLPHVSNMVTSLRSATNPSEPPGHADGAAGHHHSEHDHGHGAHEDHDSIALSPQARRNIGLGELMTVKLQPFVKTISVPGMVVERPGRSTVEVTAPMTGIITRIYPLEGEAVEPGARLFDLRLTHEELVQSQADLLKTAEELDVNAREIERIQKLIDQQALPGKQLVERKYERQKLEAVLRAQRQALLLHGLSGEQIDRIVAQRKLLQDLTVTVPRTTDDGGMSPEGTIFQVQNLHVAQGQHVSAGDTLAVLADHAQLFIQGEAFERDIRDINRAAEAQLAVSATIGEERGQPEVISGLSVLYLAAQVDPESRTLDFFVTLPNRLDRDTRLEAGRRFVAWRYRPGQRVQLQVPIETLPDRIVLPAAAVAQEGPETYVFSPDGDHFDRRRVHVEYRDSQWVVIANDGSLFPGDLVAPTGAQQLQLAIKNQSGGPIDPHAGHHH